jgi:rhodanese-related sulfurtransferase
LKDSKIFFIFRIIIILLIVMFLTGFILLAGCNTGLSKKEPIPITVEKVYEILKTQKDSFIILDVRIKEEFDSGHLDSAVLIPVDDLEVRYGEITKNRPIIVYCKSGRRSAKAADLLVGKDFSPVYEMIGGIDAWISKEYPVIVENSASGTTEVIEINYITADELNAKLNKNEDIIILDVRSEDSYMIEHIKDAVNIPYSELEGRTGDLDNTKEIIIYCDNYDCGLSKNAVSLLVKVGFKNVLALEGGIESWQDKGYPVE